jgi:hypothetical protein
VSRGLKNKKVFILIINSCARYSSDKINKIATTIFLIPISVNEFQEGNIVDGSSKIVLDFLLTHRDQAFTQDEVIKGVNPDPSPESFVHFLAAKFSSLPILISIEPYQLENY